MAGELVSKEIEFLLEIADACEKGGAVSGGKTMEDRFHYLIESPIFKEYGLDEDDVRITAILFRYFLDKEDGMEGRDLVKKVGEDRKSSFMAIKRLERLRDIGVLDEAEELLDIISRAPHEKFQDKKLLDKDGRLVKEKMIEISSREHRFSDMEFIKLADNLRMRLLEDNKRRNRMRLKRDNLFEIIKPSISLDKVILHPRTWEEINLALEMVRGKALSLLNEWGVKGSNLIHSASRKKQQPATMLFYGPPGTGKSLTANAVAYALKRTLLTFDCSRILSAWVGESEQNTRRIFDRYREIAKGMKNPPVLLLNEADQFLHRRINAARAVDHMYNQMQNIFLEQLEQFKGILIATTNLSENLDPAFSRRFHLKIEFRRPGPEERLRLWQVHMPEKAPLAEDVNLQYLAEHYDLSGGQIAVVVRNAATRAARRGDKICQRDFIRACESEITGNFDEKARGKVGF